MRLDKFVPRLGDVPVYTRGGDSLLDDDAPAYPDVTACSAELTEGVGTRA